MRKSTLQFLQSLNAKAESIGLTGFVDFNDKNNLKEPATVFFEEQLNHHIDAKTKHFSEWMCKEKFVPCPDNWKLVSPHWYKMDNNSGTRFSFEDINKLYILTHESK